MPTNQTIEYWAEQLRQNNNEMAPILSLMYDQHCSLTTMQQYELRECLSRNAALVSLLNEELHQPMPPKTKLWKKLFQK